MNNLDNIISQKRLIDNIKIIINSKTRISYAFIGFINAADADSAIKDKNGYIFKKATDADSAIKEKDGYTFKEQQLCVEYSKNKNSSLVERPNNSSCTKVYVGNLPLAVSEEDIKKLFNGITVGDAIKEAAQKYIIFLKSGLHVNEEKAMTRNKTIIVYAIGNIFNKCIVRLEESDSTSKESKGMHAEEKMIEFLKQHVKKNIVKDVYVYLSNSPCHKCAIKLGIYSKERGIKFHIHFVGLYRCYRKSCTNEECCNFEKSNNEDAVRNLNSHDQFKMSTFAPDTWNTLSFLIITYYKQQMTQMALKESNKFQILYLLMVNNTFKIHQIEREKEDQNMKSDLEHLLNATSENQREGEAEHDRTSDNEDQEGQSGSGNGGGSSKEETDKSEDQDDDDDKRVNRNQPKPKNQERQSNYQINDNPSSGYESDSTFDSSIWDMLNAYEESKEFQDINKNITIKHNKYTTNKTQDKHTLNAYEIASDTDATDALNDDESDSKFDSSIWDEINAYEDSKEFKNIEKNFTEQKCIVKPNSVSSKKQKKHGVTKKTEQFRSYTPLKRDYDYKNVNKRNPVNPNTSKDNRGRSKLPANSSKNYKPNQYPQIT